MKKKTNFSDGDISIAVQVFKILNLTLYLIFGILLPTLYVTTP